MTKDNFKEMRENKITEVMIPVIRGHRYRLPIFAHFFHATNITQNDPIGCQVKNEFGATIQLDVQYVTQQHHMYVHAGRIPVNVDNSGLYKFVCSTVLYDEYSFSKSTRVASVSVRMTFFIGKDTQSILCHG